ncbi:MAG: cell division protein FtsZ [Dysgonamonadaceae bacterium]|jgi:cell division protein FtsZ|nr:cell division protein FtsZ [Dysgonamonadaceae bacterium]
MEEDIIFNTEDNRAEAYSFVKDGVVTLVNNKPAKEPTIIKVVGVGGGGGNAVTHMYKEGIHNVSFVLCNTDNQVLAGSEIPTKVQLGIKTTEGLGAGGIPEVAKKAAEESLEDLKKMLSDGTKMVFITAGMGGGTGTGAAPVIAGIAKKMGILTVGIVTIPFVFEGVDKILKALKGVEEMEKNVDALLVINNERLREIYSDLPLAIAFKKADDTLTVAAKSIAEIITIRGIINLDFADVNTTLREGGVAIMSSGLGKGENRVSLAIENALKSPLLNSNNIFKSKRVLFNIYDSQTKPLMTEEMDEVHEFMAKFDSGIKLIWGAARDENLGENVKMTILATGFGIENIPLSPEVVDAQRQLTEKDLNDRMQDDNEKRIEKERQLAYEAKLLSKYYPDEVAALTKGGKTIRPKPFIFTIENMNDNETIEALIAHPAYNRSSKIMLDIAKKAENRRKERQQHNCADET